MKASPRKWRIVRRPRKPPEPVEDAICRMLADHPKGLTITQLHELTPRYGIPYEHNPRIYAGRGFWGNPIYLGGETYSHKAALALSTMLRDHVVGANRYGLLVLMRRQEG